MQTKMMSFRRQAGWAEMILTWSNVINLFTTIIHCNSIVIPSFYVIKHIPML
jgi:hypothetical protein